MDLDGHVVAPGDTFDFWNAIGPVTRARGYRQGGAIINGRTELQGALAGGICSTSTTLFNAVARAGYEMGARRNHFYYIDRYPLGLDATVFKGDSSTQTMSFTNDTRYPVLIRAYKIATGARLREVRAVQRADRSQGHFQPADREELPGRERHDPVHRRHCRRAHRSGSNSRSTACKSG
jgi:vancomycin resistance protein YoaR